MGKKQDHGNKLYIQQKEYAEVWGGFLHKNLPFSKLPLHCCALTLQKFSAPVCTQEGHVFEVTAIVPFLKKYGCRNPVTGDSLTIKELIPMRFMRNDLNEIIDPVFEEKMLKENTLVGVNLVSGYVYAYDTLLNMCKKPRSFKDPITNEGFDWQKDVVIIQNPDDPSKREVNTFWHVKEKIGVDEEEEEKKGKSSTTTCNNNSSSSSSSNNGKNNAKNANGQIVVVQQGGADEEKDGEILIKKVGENINMTDSLRQMLEARKIKADEMEKERDLKRRKKEEEEAKQHELDKKKQKSTLFTSGAASRSFTSTIVSIDDTSERGNNMYRLNTDLEERKLLYKEVKQGKKNVKGYVKLEIGREKIILNEKDDTSSSSNRSNLLVSSSTTTAYSKKHIQKNVEEQVRYNNMCVTSTTASRGLQDEKNNMIKYDSIGSLNIELHADIAPIACDNFLRHCASGYYSGCLFHRLVENFVLQTGDPAGTGVSDFCESAFDNGKEFPDEIDSRLQFANSSKGILAMARPPGERNTNLSQFFITLRDDISSLDKEKYTIFGRVVGNLNLLSTICGLEVDAKSRPKTSLRILGIQVFSDPFRDYIKAKKEKEEKEEKDKKEAQDAMWFSNRKDPMEKHSNRKLDSVVGKYLFGSEVTNNQKNKTRLSLPPSSTTTDGYASTVVGGSGARTLDDLFKSQQQSREEMSRILQTLSKEEREYAAASRKVEQKKAFQFKGW